MGVSSRRSRPVRVAGRMVLDRIRTGSWRAPTAWAIGIYQGDSPFEMVPYNGNPVLRAQDVSDIHAEFVADPFMVRWDGCWHMFFEVLNSARGLGEIGAATSQDGFEWRYEQIVLSADHHLSYPFVFVHEDRFYMIPEESELSAIRIYSAIDLLGPWEVRHVVAEGLPYEDASLIRHKGRWWIFASVSNSTRTKVFAFSSDELESGWQRHPIVHEYGLVGRPGGRPVVHDGRLIRFVQESTNVYGEAVQAFEITHLDATDFCEQPVGGRLLEGSGVGWNAARMHTFDAHLTEAGSFLACLDGRGYSSAVDRFARLPGVHLRPYGSP